jgi:hypothetical protein
MTAARADPVTAMSESDSDLIRRSGAEPQLFGQIFDRHATTVHRYLTRRIGAVAAAVAVVATHSGEQPGAPSVVAAPKAARVLRLAAAEARTEPVLPAKPGEFVFVQSRAAWAGAMQPKDGEAVYEPAVEQARLIWLSVDGNKDGLLRADPGEARHRLPRTRPRRHAADRLIFDSTSYKFLGERDVVVDAKQAEPFPQGAVIGWTAQLKIAIVDQVGQQP